MAATRPEPERNDATHFMAPTLNPHLAFYRSNNILLGNSLNLYLYRKLYSNATKLQRLGRGNSPTLPGNDRSEFGVRRAMMMLAWPYGLDRPSLSSLFLAAPARARRPPGRHLSPVHSLFMIRKRHDGWKTRRDSGPEVDRERGARSMCLVHTKHL